MKRWLLGICLLLAASGCKDGKDGKSEATGDGEAVASATAAAAASGSAAAQADPCKAYLAALDACIEELGQGQAAEFVRVREQQAKALKNASAPGRRQMESGCQTGLATLRQDDRCH